MQVLLITWTRINLFGTITNETFSNSFGRRSINLTCDMHISEFKQHGCHFQELHMSNVYIFSHGDFQIFYCFLSRYKSVFV